MPSRAPALELEIWRHSGLLRTLVFRDIRSRYAGSRLGAAWAFVQPVVTLTLYVVVFSTIIQGGRFAISGTTAGYTAYLLPALLAWQWTSDCLVQAGNSVASQGALLRKVAFPAPLLPLTQMLSTSLPLLCVMATFFLGGMVAGLFPWAGLAWLPLVLIGHALLLAGPILLLASFGVFLRDIVQAMPSVLQALFWATPIIYTVEMVAGRFPVLAWWYTVNPAAHLVSIYREVLLLGTPPSLGSAAYLSIIGLATYLAGRWTFQRLRPAFADET